MNKQNQWWSGNSWMYAASVVVLATAISIFLINQQDSSQAYSVQSHNQDNDVFLAEGVFKKLTNQDSIHTAQSENNSKEHGENGGIIILNEEKRFSDAEVKEAEQLAKSKKASDAKKSNTTSQIAQKDSSKTIETPKGTAFSVSKQVACIGESIDFDIVNDNTSENYLWNFGNGDFSDEASASTTYNEPGTYKVIMTVTSDANGQMRRIENESEVRILPTPVAKFDYELVNSYSSSPQVKLINKSVHAMNSNWEIDGNLFSNEISPIMSINDGEQHVLKLEVLNEYGCSDSEFKYIQLESDFNLLADKSFSPNNDGRNDKFIPSSLRLLDNEFKFSVFKDGEIVFESTSDDQVKEWDGSLKDGSKAQVNDTYQWVVIILDDDKQEQYYGGEITIVP